MKLKAIDFFCGAGGLTHGLVRSGIEVIAGIDVDNACAESFIRNNIGVSFISRDIRDLDVSQIRKFARTKDFSEYLFAGCAPCQPFSKQRRLTSRHKDATILAEFGRIVCAAKPGFVLIENVPGIEKVSGNSTFRRFIKSLESVGYKVEKDVLDAKYFGVPQSRKRLVLIASRFGKPSLPEPRFGFDGLEPVRTVKQAISHFPPIRAGSESKSIPNHRAAGLSPLNLERMQHTPKNGGDRRDWPRRLKLQCHQDAKVGFYDVYGRLHWNQPAPSLTGKCCTISTWRYGHPTQNRAITHREAAALQSFPDEYEFVGTFAHVSQQIGNAVPVLFAEHLGKEILNISKRHRG